MSKATEQTIVENRRAKSVEKISRRDEQRISSQASADATLRRAQVEVNRSRIENKVSNSPEALVRQLEKSEVGLIPKDGRGEFHSVQKIEPRFQSIEQIAEHRQQAWQKLAHTREGKLLIHEAGGKEDLARIMADGRHDFLTHSATLCEKAGLDDDAIGRNVHRLAELYTLEKCPKDLLTGIRQVEQRINYVDREGKAHHVKLDDITRMRDGRVVVRDYKPINLSHFERTNGGKAWAEWAEKAVGPDFRERIQAGSSPFFNAETRGAMPKSIRSALQGYLKEITHHHRTQLEKYSNLYSAANEIDRMKVKTAVIPYYKFSAGI